MSLLPGALTQDTTPPLPVSPAVPHKSDKNHSSFVSSPPPKLQGRLPPFSPSFFFHYFVKSEGRITCESPLVFSPSLSFPGFEWRTLYLPPFSLQRQGESERRGARSPFLSPLFFFGGGTSFTREDEGISPPLFSFCPLPFFQNNAAAHFSPFFFLFLRRKFGEGKRGPNPFPLPFPLLPPHLPPSLSPFFFLRHSRGRDVKRKRVRTTRFPPPVRPTFSSFFSLSHLGVPARIGDGGDRFLLPFSSSNFDHTGSLPPFFFPLHRVPLPRFLF